MKGRRDPHAAALRQRQYRGKVVEDKTKVIPRKRKKRNRREEEVDHGS